MWEVGVFISCVNPWRYFHLMGSSILTLWGRGQSKSLFLQPRHSHVMRKPTGHGEISGLSCPGDARIDSRTGKGQGGGTPLPPMSQNPCFDGDTRKHVQILEPVRL